MEHNKDQRGAVASGKPQFPWNPDPINHEWTQPEIAAIHAFGESCYQAGIASAQGSAAVRGEAVAEELREIDVVLSENDRLREALADKISGETLLTELNMNQGGLNMQFEGGACQMLAEQFAQQFRDMGGDNYIEMGFTARSDGMPLLVTIQRVSGKTPATLKTEAEARLSTAKDFHRSLCERFGYSHDDKDWLRDLVSLEEFIAAKVSAPAADAHSEPSERVMRAALERIARWHGEFPETGREWEDHTPMSYGAAFGSNGERDYMRQIALDALTSRAADALDSQPTDSYLAQTILELTPGDLDRALRTGRNLLERAKAAGWPDDGEGAYEFLQRKVYEVAYQDGASSQPTEPPICRDDGRCQYAIEHQAEGMGHCPVGKCCMPDEESVSLETACHNLIVYLDNNPPMGESLLCVRQIRNALARSQPTDGGVRNG